MRPADWPRDDGLAERLLVVDAASGRLLDTRVGSLGAFVRSGDLVVVNDAATLPASLAGHTARGEPVELRLASALDDGRWLAVAFGAGDWRTRTEHRPPPPALRVCDTLAFGAPTSEAGPDHDVPSRPDALHATVDALSPLSPRLLTLRFQEEAERFWRGLYALGRPVQYAHVRAPLPLWHTQTRYAGRPWAFEMPSAGRPLRWSLLEELRAAGVTVASLTHAAGLSATGDAALDAALPLPERYDIPEATIAAIARTRAAGGRVVAIGTSVVRSLEGSAAAHAGAPVAGVGVTALRVGPGTLLCVVDAILSGMHEPGTSHFELLGAFAAPTLLLEAVEVATSAGYLAHELGDSCLVMAA